MYAVLLRRLADDVAAGGPAAEVLAGREEDPGPAALVLRLMGGVHRLVLQRRATALALHYPSVGGDGDTDSAWPALRDLLVSHRQELQSLLDQAPQTNEVGRAAALVGGLHHVVARRAAPVRLVEIGASAGLNLMADYFRVTSSDGPAVGPAASRVVLADAWRGRLPPLDGRLGVVERFGCDTAPLDPRTDEGRLRLTSYVWPDQHARLERLRGALALAQEVRVVVEPAGAGDFLQRLTLVPGTTTVLWHSVMWQYLSREEQDAVSARIEELGAGAEDRAGFAHLLLEPRRPDPGSDHEFQVVLRTWPGEEERVLGTAQPHGVPVMWR